MRALITKHLIVLKSLFVLYHKTTHEVLTVSLIVRHFMLLAFCPMTNHHVCLCTLNTVQWVLPVRSMHSKLTNLTSTYCTCMAPNFRSTKFS